MTPDQFQLLKAAEQLGNLDLSLRNREDKEPTDVAELNDSVFFGVRTSGGDRTAQPDATPPIVPSPNVNDFLTSVQTGPSLAPSPAPRSARTGDGRSQLVDAYWTG